MGAFVEEVMKMGNIPVNYENCAKPQKEKTVSEKIGNCLSGTKTMLEVITCIENKLGIIQPEQCNKQTTPSGIIEALSETETNMQILWDKINKICNIL